MTRPTLIVFARVPAIGVGKSRLARDIGRVEAWRLSRALLDRALRRLRDPRWDVVVRVTPDRFSFPLVGKEVPACRSESEGPCRRMRGTRHGSAEVASPPQSSAQEPAQPAAAPVRGAFFLHKGERVEPQGGGDLGARLTRAIRAHARGAVMVVGTDAPGLGGGHVAAGFASARRHGAAIGPAADGGFWGLALSPGRARRVDLSGVRWSGPHACEDTVAALGGGVVRLATLIDVDDLAALRAWRDSSAAGRGGGPW